MKLVALEKLVDILDNLRVPINASERSTRIGSIPYYGATGQVGTIDKAIFNETLILLGEDGVPFFDSDKHKAYEISGPSWVNNHAHVLRAKPHEVIQRYLLHFLNSFDYSGFVNGSTRLKLTQASMKKIPVPLPTLKVQQLIVEKLDKAFAEIDLLEKNLQLKEEKTNQLLQSILKDAFTENQEFEMKKVKLGDICELKGGGTPSKVNKRFYQGEIPWATVRDLKTRWLQVTQHKINFNAVQSSSTNVIPSGTVILATRVGLGKVVQLRQDTAINQDLRALIPKDKSNVLNEFIYYWVLANTSLIIKEGKGATVQGVTLPFLQKLILPFPSLKYQKLIVKKLDKAFAEIEFLKSQLALEKQMAAALRQSILSNAFDFADEAA